MGIQHRTIPGGCLLAGRCGSSGGIVFDVAGLPTRPVVPWSDRLDLPSNCPICRFFEPNMEKNAFDFASQNPNCLEFDLLVSYSRKQNCCIIVTHIDFGSVTDFRSPKLWISTGIPRLIWVPKDFYRFLEALCQSLRGKIPRYPWLFNFVSTWAKAVSNAWFFHRGQRKTTWNTSLVGSVGFMSYRCFHNLGMGQDHRGDELIATILGFWPIAIGQNESN